MKSLTKLLCGLGLLIALLLGSCDSYYEIVTEDYLLYMDSSGVVTLLPLPIDKYDLYGIHRLADGSAILAGYKLHHWNPATGEVQDITPANFIAYPFGRSISCSPDGEYIYYGAEKMLGRIRTDDFGTETIISSTSLSYFNPRISQDGRYLAYMCQTQSYGNNYPAYYDLETNQSYSLNTGTTSQNNNSSDVLVVPEQNRVYFHINYYSTEGLWFMNMDGSGRSLITKLIPSAGFTSDGRYLLPIATDLCYYRDNNTNIWYYLNNTASFGFGTDANEIFYFQYSSGKTYKYSLETQESTLLIDGVIDGKKVYQMSYLSPDADGSTMVAMMSVKVE